MGDRHERELVNAFRGAGWGAMRAPGSGSATAYAVADVIFGHRIEVQGITGPLPSYSEIGFIEHKKSGNPRAYYTAEEVESLRSLPRVWGGTAYLGARFTRSVDGNDKVHYLVPVDRAETLDSGKWRVHANDAEKRASIIVNASTGEVRVL